MSTSHNKSYPDHVDTDPGTPALGRFLAMLYNHWPWFRQRFQRNLATLAKGN